MFIQFTSKDTINAKKKFENCKGGVKFQNSSRTSRTVQTKMLN